jgi:hypothetical protein
MHGVRMAVAFLYQVLTTLVSQVVEVWVKPADCSDSEHSSTTSHQYCYAMRLLNKSDSSQVS